MNSLWAPWSLLFLGVVSACSASGSIVAPARSQTAETRDVAVTASPRLYVLEGGLIARPIDNGAVVAIAKGISAEIYFAPYPPALDDRLDIFLFEPRSGAAIGDGQVTIKYEMLYMDHGQYRLNASSKGNGHYEALLEFDMFGDWLVDIYSGNGQQIGSVRLKLAVDPR